MPAERWRGKRENLVIRSSFSRIETESEAQGCASIKNPPRIPESLSPRGKAAITPSRQSHQMPESRSTIARVVFTTKQPTAQALSERARRAGESWEWVCKERPDLTSEEAGATYTASQHAYIREHGCPAYPDSGPQLPTDFSTWARYVREYKNHQEGPSRMPRGARPHGSSIVPIGRL